MPDMLKHQREQAALEKRNAEALAALKKHNEEEQKRIKKLNEEEESAKTAWKALKNCWKKDNYRRAALITVPIAFGLLLFFICGGEFFMPQWCFDLLLPEAFVGSALSGATYLARPLDSDIPLAEKIGIITFACLGFAVTMAIGVLTKVTGIVNIIRLAVFCIGSISSLAGLGNRLCSSINKDIPKNERTGRITGAVIGAALGAVLCVFAKAALLTTASIFIPGAAIVLPAVLSSVVLGASISSTGASACDYAFKAWNYYQYVQGNANPDVIKRIEKSPYEYRGSAVGVISGLVVAALICLFMPHVGGLIVGLAIGAVVIAGCCSVIGGLCSRIGRTIDGSKKEPIKTIKDDSVNPEPSSKLNQSPYNKNGLAPSPKATNTNPAQALPAVHHSPIAAPKPKSPARVPAIQPTPVLKALVPA